MFDLRDLYQEVILDHNNNPRNCREQCTPSCRVKGHNPLCGDEWILYVKYNGDVIEDVSFTGHGCAISTASASLMTEALIGKSKAHAEQLFKAFHAMLTDDKCNPDETQLGKLSVLAGVKAFPVRVKCATLAWHTLASALNNEQAIVSTE